MFNRLEYKLAIEIMISLKDTLENHFFCIKFL